MPQSVRRIIFAVSAAFVALIIARPAIAQSAPSDGLQLPLMIQSVSFIPDDDPGSTQAPPPQHKHHEGFGIGIKGGPAFDGLSSDGTSTFGTKTGYQISLFLGGNRPGLFGVATEITYVKRNEAAAGSTTTSTTSTALEVPLLFRFNFGSKNLTGLLGYFMVGPALDVNLTKFGSFFKNTQSFDVNLVFSGGVEITRFIVELRYNKGLRTIANTLTSAESVKTHSIILLFGVRFN